MRIRRLINAFFTQDAAANPGGVLLYFDENIAAYITKRQQNTTEQNETEENNRMQ